MICIIQPIFILVLQINQFIFSIEVFDSDRLGRDKSLGKLDLDPDNMDAGQPQWFPLKGAKSGQILLNTEFLAPGDIPSSETSGSKPIIGNIFFNHFSKKLQVFKNNWIYIL